MFLSENPLVADSEEAYNSFIHALNIFEHVRDTIWEC